MPVTVKPSPQLVDRNSDFTVHSAQELLKATSRAWSVESPRSWSSFRDLNSVSVVVPYGNGLVNGIIRAFQQDLHLILRPDDIWLSILTQFSMFVNANAEDLRAHFVAHEGKKELKIDVTPYPVWDIEMGNFAQEMTALMQENVGTRSLETGLFPTLKYFEYMLSCGCGFPSVTLLGEKSDWEEILYKVQKLPKYGNETAEWSRLLAPIIRHMIATFDKPESQRIKDFWLRACHSASQDGSMSIETLSGWITALCFWSEDGKRIPSPLEELLKSQRSGASLAERKRLILDGVPYPMISPKSIPKGVVSVPVTIQDLQSRLEYKTTIVAGSVGMTATADSPGKNQTTVQPRLGWWMLQDSVKPIPGALQQQEANHSTLSTV